MIDKLNAYPYEVTEDVINITDAYTFFDNISTSGYAKVYSGTTAITWSTFDWSNIPEAPLNNWLANADDLDNPSTTLIEVLPYNFITGAGLVKKANTSGSGVPLSVNVDVAATDLFTDFIIPFGEEVPSSLTVTSTGNVYSAVRSNDPTVEDYTDFSVHNDVTALNDLQALADTNKALHLYFEGVTTNTATFEIPKVKEYTLYNHKDNRTALPYLQDDAQDFNGLNQYNHFTASNNTPEKNVEQLFIFSFYYTSSGAGQIILGGTREGANDFPHYQFNIVPTGNVFQLVLRANWTSGTTTQNQWRGTIGLKTGYNSIIVHYRNYTGVNDVDFYINGIKDTLTFSQLAGGITAGTSFAVAKNYSIGRLTDTFASPTNLTGSYFNGSMKVLQWLDVTGITVNTALIKAILEQQDARNLIDFTNAVLDVDFDASPLADRSTNAYTITTFNGLTQTSYL